MNHLIKKDLQEDKKKTLNDLKNIELNILKNNHSELNFDDLNTFKNSFSEKIKFLRSKYNLTQYELALILNIDRTTISSYEKNKKMPSFDVIINISILFNVAIDYLLGLKND